MTGPDALGRDLLRVACPYCRAEVGERCRVIVDRGGDPAKVVRIHSAREDFWRDSGKPKARV